MVSNEIRKRYIPTIGIECHVQLKTETKLFAAVSNDAREAEPNTLISHICLGMPGALPVLNKQAVTYAMKVAFAFNTEPQRYSYFERKHYFYPDLPKGYQITQLSKPIIVGGSVEIKVDGESKEIPLNRVQIEEDAGKNTHPAGADYSLVDLNRAGTPLLEIVSEPAISSATEAKAYARELYLLMRYTDVSDADLYHGNMRFDVNVSVSKEPGRLGTRTETKNLNSFRSVEKAVEYEIDRQITLLEKGEKVIQETRGWDDIKQITISQRGKEEAHDYRYFPDPDLPPIVISDDDIERVRRDLSLLPNDYRRIFENIGFDPSVTEDIVSVPDMATAVSDIYEKAGVNHAKRAAFWLLWKTGSSSEDELHEGIGSAPVATLVGTERIILLSEMVESNKLSSTAAKDIFYEMIKDKRTPQDIAESMNLLQVSDEGEIAAIVTKVLEEHESAANDVKNGEMKAIGFLVGQVMKASHGKANPQLAQKLIREQLERR